MAESNYILFLAQENNLSSMKTRGGRGTLQAISAAVFMKCLLSKINLIIPAFGEECKKDTTLGNSSACSPPFPCSRAVRPLWEVLP